MNFVKTISTELNDLSQRVVKVLRYGKSDVQTAAQAAPYGIDSNPVKDMIAVYGKTSDKGKPVIIGYVNKGLLADEGEVRLYATDTGGEIQTSLWLRNDGTMEVGGDSDNMVRFSDLKTVIEEMQNDIGDLKSAFSSWTPVPNDGGAALKAAASSWAGSPLTEDIDNAKIDEILTL